MSERAQRLKAELFSDDLTVDEVAEVLTLDRSTILRYLREGTIAGYKTGREWLVKESAVRSYVQRARRVEEE